MTQTELRDLALRWARENESPAVESTLADAGWEIGWYQADSLDGCVFVIQAGDINGKTFECWEVA